MNAANVNCKRYYERDSTEDVRFVPPPPPCRRRTTRADDFDQLDKHTYSPRNSRIECVYVYPFPARDTLGRFNTLHTFPFYSRKQSGKEKKHGKSMRKITEIATISRARLMVIDLIMSIPNRYAMELKHTFRINYYRSESRVRAVYTFSLYVYVFDEYSCFRRSND